MYINDTHILYYVVAAIFGLFVGQFVEWMNHKLLNNQKIFDKEMFQELKIDFKPNYILMLITSTIYVALVYRYGIQNTIIGNLNLIKYVMLTPLLLSAFVIDYKKQIIPNRLNLTILELGLIVTFIYGMSNATIAVDMLLGSIIGCGIFFIISLLGSFIYGKEALGFGDVKLMGALGLYFGVTNIVAISITSFLIGAIIGIFLITTRIKKIDEYIPFGPFIVIGTFICIFIPSSMITKVLVTIFTLGIYKN